MIGVLLDMHVQSTFGVCLALEFLLKGAGQFADTLGWSPGVLCKFFEAGLHDPIHDIYKT